jgi:hypothetical protein
MTLAACNHLRTDSGGSKFRSLPADPGYIQRRGPTASILYEHTTDRWTKATGFSSPATPASKAHRKSSEQDHSVGAEIPEHESFVAGLIRWSNQFACGAADRILFSACPFRFFCAVQFRDIL